MDKSFYRNLNQPPRSASRDGKHRRTSPPAHSRPADRASDRPRGSAAISPRGAAIRITFTNSGGGTVDLTTHMAALFAEPAIPHAGVRAGELTGYRLWWLVAGHLCSLTHRQLWLPGEVVSGDVDSTINGILPAFGGISGGVYAFKEASQLPNEVHNMECGAAAWDLMPAAGKRHFLATSLCWIAFSETQTLVSGRVKMWGEVVEHRLGYRAQHAKVTHLDAVHGPGDLGALRRKYGLTDAD